MSVLIEALSLVVPRWVLDVSYPGGTDAFSQAMCAPGSAARRLCADDNLVSVSFFTPEAANAVAQQLTDLGLVVVDDDFFFELAFVDQKFGPTMPCDWLEWRRHEEGFTAAWLAGYDPGDLAVPEDWTPEQSRALESSDIRDEPGRYIRLAVEDGLETWLDFKTGEIRKGFAHREESAPAAPASDARAVDVDSIVSVICAMLDESGLKHVQYAPYKVSACIPGTNGLYQVTYVVGTARPSVVCHFHLGSRVSEASRAAMAELLMGINQRSMLVSYEVEFMHGTIRARRGIEIGVSSVSTHALRDLTLSILEAVEYYHATIMSVAFGQLTPAEALKALELNENTEQS